MQNGLYQALAAMFPDLPPLVLIAIAELMTYICVACVRGRSWRGQSKWYASDNFNTVGWLRDRYSQHPIVQFLLRILGISESTWSYDTVGSYIRTYRNLVPDDMTRERWAAAVAVVVAGSALGSSPVPDASVGSGGGGAASPSLSNPKPLLTRVEGKRMLFRAIEMSDEAMLRLLLHVHHVSVDVHIDFGVNCDANVNANIDVNFDLKVDVNGDVEVDVDVDVSLDNDFTP